MSSILNTYFDKIFLINLKRRTDRLKESEKFFDLYNIKYELFEAVINNAMQWKHEKLASGMPKAFEGISGCLASHLKIYKLAKEKEYKRILIIEDDADFVDNFENHFNRIIKDIPVDWDLLYFGSIHESHGRENMPEAINEYIVKTKRVITTTSYGVDCKIYDLLIDTIEKELPYVIKPIDVYLSDDVQPKCNSYAFHPPLAWQRKSFSDIQQGNRDYSNLMRYNNIK